MFAPLRFLRSFLPSFLRSFLRSGARAARSRLARLDFSRRRRSCHDDADARGRRGERAAVRHLRRVGYRVLARRLRTRGGEVDVLALDGPTLVLVEVKTTLGAAAAARARVDRRKQDRQRSAYRALARHPRFAGRPYRFDVVTVVLEGRRPTCALHRGFATLSR